MNVVAALTSDTTFRRMEIAAMVFVFLLVPTFIALRLHEGLALQQTVAVQGAKIEALESHIRRLSDEMHKLRVLHEARHLEASTDDRR